MKIKWTVIGLVLLVLGCVSQESHPVAAQDTDSPLRFAIQRGNDENPLRLISYNLDTQPIEAIWESSTFGQQGECTQIASDSVVMTLDGERLMRFGQDSVLEITVPDTIRSQLINTPPFARLMKAQGPYLIYEVQANSDIWFDPYRAMLLNADTGEVSLLSGEFYGGELTQERVLFSSDGRFLRYGNMQADVYERDLVTGVERQIYEHDDTIDTWLQPIDFEGEHWLIGTRDYSTQNLNYTVLALDGSVTPFAQVESNNPMQGTWTIDGMIARFTSPCEEICRYQVTSGRGGTVHEFATGAIEGTEIGTHPIAWIETDSPFDSDTYLLVDLTYIHPNREGHEAEYWLLGNHGSAEYLGPAQFGINEVNFNLSPQFLSIGGGPSDPTFYRLWDRETRSFIFEGRFPNVDENRAEFSLNANSIRSMN